MRLAIMNCVDNLLVPPSVALLLAGQLPPFSFSLQENNTSQRSLLHPSLSIISLVARLDQVLHINTHRSSN